MKQYIALLTDARGELDVQEQFNNFTNPASWSSPEPGVFDLTIQGEFPDPNKVSAFFGQGANPNLRPFFGWYNEDKIRIATVDAQGAYCAGELNASSVWVIVSD